MKNLGDIIRFIKTMLSNLKPRKTKIQNQYYGALMKEHLDTLTNSINRHEKFKNSLDYNLKVLLPEALVKLTQVTLKCNRLEAEFYLNGIVAGTDCDKIFSKRLVPNSSESWYVLPKWENLLAIEICNSYSFCKIFIFCQYKLLGMSYQTCCNKENICKLYREIFGQSCENWTWGKLSERM